MKTGTIQRPVFLNNTNTRTMINNTISHIEIPAPDLQKAIDFYASVFNWNIQVVNEGVYAFFKIGNTNTGGGLDASLRPAEMSQGAQIVVDVANIEKTLEDITGAGGTVVRPKTEIGDGHGFYAVFRDPNGNYLQVHARH